jgi:peroxiredoxin
VEEHLPEIRALGGELIVVTQSCPEHLQTRLEVEPKPFPVVCDPDRTVYREFGLLPGKARMFLSFKVIGSYLSRMFQGWKVRMPMKNEDLLQLGGDFVLDHSRHLILAYRSADPTDRPSIEQLLKALRTAK